MMATHRSLTAHLADWTPQQVARLLQRRPDLVERRTPADLGELADRAQRDTSLRLAIDATTLPQNRLLQVVACFAEAVPLDALARALPDGVGLDDIEPILDSLEQAALVWRHDGHVHCPKLLRQVMPTRFGPPLRRLEKDVTVEHLRHAIERLCNTPGLPAKLLSDRMDMKRSRPRKTDLITELEALLAMPELMSAVLESAPDEVREIAAEAARGSRINTGYGFYYSPYYQDSYHSHQPAYWLFERAMLVTERNSSNAVMPREAGIGLSGGQPIEDLPIAEPRLATQEVDPVSCDAEAGLRAVTTLGLMADILARWTEAPAKELKSRGLGVSLVRKLAQSLDTCVEDTSRVIELLNVGGLIETTTIEQKEGRKRIWEDFVQPSDAAEAWLGAPLQVRWRQIAKAWLRADLWPSVTGPKDKAGELTSDKPKARPVLTMQYPSGAPDCRAEVMSALAQLDDGNQATNVDALRTWVYWQHPQPWLGIDAGSPDTLIAGTYAEAELLGIVAHGRLSSFGKALVDGDFKQAEHLLDSCAPDEASTFTLQADMTAVVVGRLDREVLVELRLLAEAESSGAASTFRFSEPSLRRAIDAGRDATSILGFLQAHADKGVPQALEYMVRDVARRHGHLTVGGALAFVTSEDAAVLADACSHRRTRKLGLRLLAPTVAVSGESASKVLETLRDAGFLPAAEDSVDAGGDNVVRLASETRVKPQPKAQGDLPEPFRRGRYGYVVRQAPPLLLDEVEATKHAATICAGAPSEPLPVDEPTPIEAFDKPEWDLLDEAQAEEMVIGAANSHGVLSLIVDRGDHVIGPIYVEVQSYRHRRIVGTDLETKQLTMIGIDEVLDITEMGDL